MAAASPDAVNKLVSEVRAAFISGAGQLGFSLADAEEMLKHGPAAALSWAWPSEQQRRVEALLKQLGGDVARWANVQRGWAERGLRDDGSLFNWEKWQARGRDLAKDLEKHTGQLVGEAVFTLFKAQVIDATVRQVGDIALPWRWSPGAKLAVGVAALVVAAVALRPYVAPFLRST